MKGEMKVFIIRIEVPGVGDDGPAPEDIAGLIEKGIPYRIKISRIWEPQEERICSCGAFSLHVRWSPDKGEEWLCCDCWTAEGNAPAELHQRRRRVLDRKSENQLVRNLGEQIGYGNMMYLARDNWVESLTEKGYQEGGAFAVGPCLALTVPCDCNRGVGCDWCKGSGWITKKVKELKDG